MLDGAAKVGPLFEKAAELEMPAVAITDHGNMFGAADFWEQSKRHPSVKPIIGIEAYLAPHNRYHTKPVFWGEARQRGTDEAGEGGDVSGSGSFTHMTMLAASPRGLQNLFALSSRGWFEGYYRKPRMDRETIAEHAEGVIATTGCPSGEVQTRLRLGQTAEALEAAGAFRDMFGQENFFVELMDHGLPIERSVRAGLLDIARQLDLKVVATNDSHYVTPDQAAAHEALLCVQTGKTMSDPGRFKFDGDGYYLKSAAEMREYWDKELPGAADNTLLIAEMVQSYEELFTYQDRMPVFPIPGVSPLLNAARVMLDIREVTDPMAAARARPLTVRVEQADAVAPLAASLAQYKGERPVCVVLCEGEDERVMVANGFEVELSGALLSTLNNINGVTVA